MSSGLLYQFGATQLGRNKYRVVISSPIITQRTDQSHFEILFLNPLWKTSYEGELPATFQNKELLDAFIKRSLQISYKFITPNEEEDTEQRPHENEGNQRDLIITMKGETRIRLRCSQWRDLFEVLELYFQQNIKKSSFKELSGTMGGLSTKIDDISRRLDSIPVVNPQNFPTVTQFTSLDSKVKTLEQASAAINPRIASLQNELRSQDILKAAERAVIGFASSVIGANGSFRRWNLPQLPNRGRFFNLQQDYSRIDIGKAGHYLVCTRVSTRVNTAGQYISLYQDGGVLSRAFFSGSGTVLSNSSHITEIFYFNAGRYLQVYYQFNNADLQDELQNKFFLVDLNKLNVCQSDLGKWSSGAGGGNGGYYNWNQNLILPDASKFAMNATQLDILETGFYFVSVRCTTTNVGGGYYLSLYLNGQDVARSYSTGDAQHNDSFQISEVFHFERGSNLKVYHTFNGGHTNAHSDNVFSIWKLRATGVVKFQSSLVKAPSYVGWNLLAVGQCPTDFYSLENDSQTVVIRKEGYYLISLRVTAALNAAGSYSMTLYNRTTNKFIARCSNNSSANGYLDSFMVDEIFYFPQSTQLAVQCTTSGDISNQPQCNTFSIVHLSR